MPGTKAFRVLHFLFCFLFIACMPTGESRALDNDLAKTPPMGWNLECETKLEALRDLSSRMVAQPGAARIRLSST